MLLYDGRAKRLWGYDPCEKKWSKITPKGPMPGFRGKTIGYYDPARNVFVLCAGTKVWVYRHKKSGE
jgi:hypothetical protein